MRRTALIIVNEGLNDLQAVLSYFLYPCRELRICEEKGKSIYSPWIKMHTCSARRQMVAIDSGNLIYAFICKDLWIRGKEGKGMIRNAKTGKMDIQLHGNSSQPSTSRRRTTDSLPDHLVFRRSIRIRDGVHGNRLPNVLLKAAVTTFQSQKLTCGKKHDYMYI